MTVPPKHPAAGEWLAVLAMLLSAVTAGHAQQRAYVANLGSNSVSVIDADSNSLVATVPAGNNPDGVVASRDGRLVYVANFLSDDVSVVDTATVAVIATIPVGTGPVGVGITPDGTSVYVANRGSNTVSVIDASANTVGVTIGVGQGPNAVTVTPDGKFAYVTNSFESGPGTVSVIDTAAQTVVASINVGSSPNRLAIGPEGSSVYVTNFRSWNVSVIDTATRAVATTVPVFGRPSGIAVNPNGSEFYVATLGGRVEIIGRDTNTLDGEVVVGDSPYGIATTHNGGLAYVANFGDGTVSVVDLVDESSMTSFTAGTKPFAVAVSCSGPICSQPPFTPRPTRTPTITPTVTNTPTITPTATFAVPPAEVSVGFVSGAPGDQFNVAVTLYTAGYAVAGTQNDIGFDARAPIAARTDGQPDCAVNPDINKGASAFVFRPNGCTAGIDCSAIRALVFDFSNTDPIPDGSILYTCRVAIPPDTAAGTYGLLISPYDTIVSDPYGGKVPAVGVDGAITVLLPTVQPTATSMTPKATATRTPTARPTPTSLPPVRIKVGSASGARGTQVSVAVTLRTSGFAVAGTQNDISFDPHAPIAARSNGHPDCAVNPNIDKNGTAFAFKPAGCAGANCTAIRALVLDVENTAPIADGAVLYTCQVAIPANAPAGTYPLLTSPFDMIASDPSGVALPVAGDDGGITVISTGQSGSFSSQSGGAMSASSTGCAIGQPPGNAARWPLLMVAGTLLWHRRRRLP